MTFRAVKNALHLREIAARVMGLERRVKEPLVRFDFTNLIENGGFDADAVWVKEAGWTISGGQAHHATGSLHNIQQPVKIPGNIWLKASVGITAISGTGWNPSFYVNGVNRAPGFNNNGSTTGTLSENFSSGNSGVSNFGFRQGNGGTASIDNFSVWEADPADDAPWLRLKYGYSVGKTGMIVRDGLILHPSEYTEITRDGQTFIKPLVAPGHDTEFSIWAGVDA
ncbi:hypothetical protein [Sulfitobacter sp. SH24]|uniref:hypothetical protein n=1 Tax=Sulfitobacter sp. SH24 TaxID=3421173 RepID=UPI003F508954